MLFVPFTLLAVAAILDVRHREIPNAFALLLLGWAVLQWALGLAPASPAILLAGLGAGVLIFIVMFLLCLLYTSDAADE